MVSLNFPLEDEAEKFFQVAMTTMTSRRRRREEKLKQFSISKQTPSMLQMPTFTQPKKSKKKDKKSKKSKLTHDDIGMPAGFVHLSHVGAVVEENFDLSGDPLLMQFLNKAGISKTHLNDRGTREAIKGFIKTNNVTEVIRREQKQIEIDVKASSLQMRQAPPAPVARAPRGISQKPKPKPPERPPLPKLLNASPPGPPPPPPPQIMVSDCKSFFNRFKYDNIP